MFQTRKPTSAKPAPKPVEEGPSFAYMSKLLKPNLSDVQQLYTDLMYPTNAWVTRFISQEGVTVLLEILKKKKDRAKTSIKGGFSVSGADIAIAEEAIRCIRQLLNYQTAVDVVLKKKEASTLIASCLCMDDGSLSRSIFELLAALCTVSDGTAHDFVLTGMSSLKTELNETVRFETVVKVLNQDNQPTESLISCLTFINALISTAEEVHTRIRIRQDFINLGIISILEKIKQRSEYSVQLQTAVSVFEDEMKEDKQEIKSTPIELIDPIELVKTLINTVDGTPHHSTFVSLLSELVQLCSSHVEASSIWEKLLSVVRNSSKSISEDSNDQQAVESLQKDIDFLKIQNQKLRKELDELREAYSKKSLNSPAIPHTPASSETSEAPQPPSDGAPPPVPPPGGAPGAPPPPPPPGGAPGAPPPPPPPGGVPGAPPPPGPPPLPGGPPGPPPPPGVGGPPPPPAGPSLPPKKKITPGTKMRQLNWNVVAVSKVQSTFWEKVDETKRTVDFQGLENLFSAKPAPTQSSGNIKGPIAHKKAGVILVDPKKSNNCSIMLARFKTSFKEIRDCILSLDDTLLDLETTGYLIQYIPTKEEIETLNDYDGPKEDLAKAEQYFIEIKDIPNLTLRLNGWHFKLRFDDQYDELKDDLSALLSACKEVTKSKEFHGVLEYVLSIGNYINGGTNRGAAYGFRIDTLPKLVDMKSNDGKTTLLHFLIEQIREASPELTQFPSTLSHCSHASKVSFPVLQSNAASMKKDLDILIKGLPNLSSAGPNDKFKNVMMPFVEKAENGFNSLESILKECNDEFVKVCKFFGENDKTTAPESFFTTVSSFCDSFQRIDREITEKEKAKQKLASSQGSQGSHLQHKQRNVDLLIEGLKGGDHFKKRRSGRASKVIDIQKLRQILPPETPDEPPKQETNFRSGLKPVSQSFQPQLVQPQVVQPQAVQSQVVQPHAVQPHAVQPHAVQPHAVQPHAVQPQVVQPQVVQPHVVQPHVVQPLVTQPHVQPRVVPFKPPVQQQKLIVPHCKALYDFPKEQPGELGMKKDDIVLLKRRLDDTWLEGELNGQIGAFPANYVNIIIPLP